MFPVFLLVQWKIKTGEDTKIEGNPLVQKVRVLREKYENVTSKKGSIIMKISSLSILLSS